MPRSKKDYMVLAGQFPDMLLPLDQMDPELLVTVNELVDYINVRAWRRNTFHIIDSWREPTITHTTLRKYVEMGLFKPAVVRDYVQAVPYFGGDAVEYYIGPQSSLTDMIWSSNDLAKFVGKSDHTIRQHYAQGQIVPIKVERVVTQVPLFACKEALNFWYGSFKRKRALKAPETWDEKQKVAASRGPAKRDRSKLNEWKKSIRRPFKADFEKTPTELALEKAQRDRIIPKEDRIERIDPVKLAEENRQLLSKIPKTDVVVTGSADFLHDPERRYVVGVDTGPPDCSVAVMAERQEDGTIKVVDVQEIPPIPPAPVPSTLDQRLKSLEFSMGKTEYRFLTRGVTQLRTDGASENEQQAFVDQFMKSLDAEADEYEGDDTEDGD